MGLGEEKVAYHFVSDRAMFRLYNNLVRVSATDKSSSTVLTYSFSLFLYTAADRELCYVIVVCGYGKASSVSIPARNQAMMNRGRLRIIQITAKQYFA